MGKYILLFVIVILIILLNKQTKETFNNKQVKILWMYWEQGEKNIKKNYNKTCIYGWRKLNPDWDVRVLDGNTVKKYIPEINNFKHLTIQMRSDLIRVKLLNKYGGVWADASTLPLKPLTGNIENIDNKTDIFFYRFIPKKDVRMFSSWFIIVKQPNHYLINKLEKEFSKRVAKKGNYKYFYFHETLTHLYNNDNKIKKYIDKLTLTERLPHSKMKNESLNIKNSKNLPLMFKRNKNINEITYKKYITNYLKGNVIN